MGSKSILALTASGAEAEFGSDLAFGDKRWLLDMTVNGLKATWVWGKKEQLV